MTTASLALPKNSLVCSPVPQRRFDAFELAPQTLETAHLYMSDPTFSNRNLGTDLLLSILKRGDPHKALDDIFRWMERPVLPAGEHDPRLTPGTEFAPSRAASNFRTSLIRLLQMTTKMKSSWKLEFQQGLLSEGIPSIFNCNRDYAQIISATSMDRTELADKARMPGLKFSRSPQLEAMILSGVATFHLYNGLETALHQKWDVQSKVQQVLGTDAPVDGDTILLVAAQALPRFSTARGITRTMVDLVESLDRATLARLYSPTSIQKSFIQMQERLLEESIIFWLS